MVSRQVHLDFHTSPYIPDVACEFDADAFANTFARARVQSVTVFAKCHHGHLYYSTDHAARHPSLPGGMDLLGEQIRSLHRRGIRAPVYLSVQWDEFAANANSDWVAVNADGSRVGPKPFENKPFSWQMLDMSSPYRQYLVRQLEEVLSRYAPLDGVFLDICWDQQSCSKWVVQSMLQQGADPTCERTRKRFAHEVALSYMREFRDLINRYHVGQEIPICFNSRSLWNLAEEREFFRQVEIEALPTGGWGYTYFPLNVRHVRTHGLPSIGMTARFHNSWADFGGYKPQAALEYECAQMLAHGAGCSIGDQLHPRGTLDAAAYRLIGKVYSYVEQCEPWCLKAKPVVEAAVLCTIEDYHVKAGGTYEGVVRALQELRVQFDCISPDQSLTNYPLVIVPEVIQLDDALVARLVDYVRNSGRLFVCGDVLLPEQANLLAQVAGLEQVETSPFAMPYFRFRGESTDHVAYEGGVRLKPHASTEVLADIVEPYFDRSWRQFCSHQQTPPDRLSSYAAATLRNNIAIVAFPLFRMYASQGNLAMRDLLSCCLARLLPEKLVRDNGPSHLEVTVNRQSNRIVIHLLSYAPRRRTPTIDLIEEPAVLYNLQLSLRLEEPVQCATLQPQDSPIPFEHRGGRIHLLVPEVPGHQMVVLESA
jgi:hypothetical protein